MKKCKTCAAMHKNDKGFWCEFLELSLGTQITEDTPCLDNQ